MKIPEGEWYTPYALTHKPSHKCIMLFLFKMNDQLSFISLVLPNTNNLKRKKFHIISVQQGLQWFLVLFLVFLFCFVWFFWFFFSFVGLVWFGNFSIARCHMGTGCFNFMPDYLVLAIFSRISLNNKFFSLLFVCVIFIVEKANAKPFQLTEKQWVLCIYRGFQTLTKASKRSSAKSVILV